MTYKSPEEIYNIALNRIEEAARTDAATLDLNGLGLYALPPEIGLLKGLRHLDLGHSDGHWEVGDYNFSLGGREHDWEVEYNHLSTLPPEIGQLKLLTSLDLTGNQLTDLPDTIGELTNLTSLYLKGNSLTELPASIGKLISLTNLVLDNNRLTSLPSEIGLLKSLEALSLGCSDSTLTDYDRPSEEFRKYSYDNCISQLPTEIGQCTNLKKLDLSGNKLTSLPADIGFLINLATLDVNDNQLERLPAEIGRLTNLANLDLSNNKLESLPKEIRYLTKLERLYLYGNQLAIPPEILEKRTEPQKILSYYLALISGKERALAESKFLLVGQGSVGKTSLVRRITANSFDVHELKTDGISINYWKIYNKIKEENQPLEIKLNVWDFGGQEIMHSTHQFFLTKRSLYLLVLDSRLTQEENRVEYWLKIIQSFSDESPVLIVGNKIDQHPLDIDRTGLQKKYPNIVGILQTSAATGAGIEELKAAIAEHVSNLPHVRDLLPETWFSVKTRLEELGRKSNFITHDKYLELCAENEVGDEISQRTLIGFLHDLGVVLHFQDDPRLEALGILNPQWVTNGVYKILNSHELFQNKGVLSTSMLNDILNIDGYPRAKRLFIVDMMKKFELCYDIEPDKTFLVPDLLPKDQPDLKFNGIPAFEYAYPVLPSSVITRFIVRMNQKIDDGLVWRTGVLLKIGKNTALVKADIEDRKIAIAIDGLEHTRRDAVSAIRYQLDEIHSSIKGLDAQKRVPIPEAPNAEPLDYDYLLQLERDGELEILPVKDGNRLVKVNVRKLLSGVVSETERKQSAGNTTNIYVSGDVKDSTIISGDENEVNK